MAERRGRHFVHLLSTSEVDILSTSPKAFYLSALKTGPTIFGPLFNDQRPLWKQGQGIDGFSIPFKLDWRMGQRNEAPLKTFQSRLNGIDNLGTCLMAAKKSVGPWKTFQNGLFPTSLPHFSILSSKKLLLVGLLFSVCLLLPSLRQTDYYYTCYMLFFDSSLLGSSPFSPSNTG